MTWMLKFLAVLLAFIVASESPSRAAPAERRLALVIGNASYQAGALPTPANDAGLIAQTLQAAGFDAFLVGESLLLCGNPAAKFEELFG